MSRLTELRSYFESGFLGFWIRKYRISYLIVLVLFILGIIAAMTIPKESSPSIKLGMILITTVSPGTNPEDMDALVSDKIYKEVKDVSGIDKIESTSSLGVSTLVLTLKTSADAKDVMNDVRNHVNRVTLPSDAKTPNITEIETNTNQIFSVFLYDTTNTKSRAVLIDRAKRLQKELEVIPGVDSIDLASENLASAGVAV